MWRAAALAVAVAVFSTSCGRDAPAPAEILDPIVVPPHVSTPLGARGQIVSVTPFSDVSEAVSSVAGAAARATYRSTSGLSGEATVVSGSFFLPRGSAPAGGWPVISYAHGTTGTARGCGLSSSPDLRGYAGTIGGLLTLGYAVAATDYEGLGTVGDHPYLDPQTAAFNVIDAVRALRTLAPTTSNRWLGYGDSQGGQAVWAADELTADYGAGLELVGALATKPAANVTPVVELAARGRLTADQRIVAPLLAVAAVRESGGALVVDDLLPGVTASQVTTLTGCDTGARNALAGMLDADRFVPVDARARDGYERRLRRDALPQRRVSAPLRVVYGSDDRLIFPAWTAHAVTAACALGGDITQRVAPGLGHADQLADGSDAGWVRDRFARRPAPSSCAGAG